jgi:hypothetical protein
MDLVIHRVLGAFQIGDVIHDHVVARQSHAERFRHLYFIFDQQQTHAIVLNRFASKVCSVWVAGRLRPFMAKDIDQHFSGPGK